MKKLSVSEFKAKALGVMDQVARTGETVVVTKRGKAIVKNTQKATRSYR